MFIFFTRTPWNEPPRARHQLASALSKLDNVLFIEANSFGLPKFELNKINNNLTVASTNWFYNYKFRYRLPLLNELYQAWLINKIKLTFPNNNYYLINFDHTAYLIQSYLGKRSIYYCNDNHVRSHGFPFVKKYFYFTEKKTAVNADFNICTTGWLKKKLLKFNKNTVHIPLGSMTPNHINPQYTKIKKPVHVLLLGFVSKNRTPVSVLINILQLSDVLLTIVGPVSKNVSKRLKEYNNYIEKGILIGKDLEKEIFKSDICLALYNKKDVNQGGSPNKLWQYLAFGKPVVVTGLKSVYSLKIPPKIVYISNNNENVNELIGQAINDNSKELFNKRIILAKKNSWEEISFKVNKIIINETTHSTA